MSEAPGDGDFEVLQDFFDNSNVGLHVVGSDGRILMANRAELALLGYGPEEYVGRSVAEFHADAETIGDILRRLRRGERLDGYPARLRAKDGSIRHVLISSSGRFKDGRFLSTRCFTVDVTDRIEAERALWEAQQRLAVTYEHAVAGIAEVDAEGRFMRVNEAFTETTGFSKDELLGRSLFEMTHPDEVAAEREAYARQVRGEHDRYAVEKRFVRKDGQEIWVHVMSSSVRGPDGAFLYGVRVVHDVTARKEAEARQKLLLDELNHRVKNTLATVQAFARQTARSCGSPEAFREAFEARLLALSRAHDRLTLRQWQDASLAELVGDALALHGGPDRGLGASGPDVSVAPSTALSLSMALHELGSNAVRHGALTRATGRVQVDWTVGRDAQGRPQAVTLVWRESGGPPVDPPQSSGFGSRLLRLVGAELGGRAELQFHPEGVCWRADFPLGRERAGPQTALPRTS